MNHCLIFWYVLLCRQKNQKLPDGAELTTDHDSNPKPDKSRFAQTVVGFFTDSSSMGPRQFANVGFWVVRVWLLFLLLMVDFGGVSDVIAVLLVALIFVVLWD